MSRMRLQDLIITLFQLIHSSEGQVYADLGQWNVSQKSATL